VASEEQAIQTRELPFSRQKMKAEIVTKEEVDTCRLAEEHDPRDSNLAYFHGLSSFERINAGNFTEVKRLSSGLNGDIFLYKRKHGEEFSDVAVKKLRSTTLQPVGKYQPNERLVHTDLTYRFQNSEDARTEIGVLTYLSNQPDLSPYLLLMKGIFADNRFTWLLTEYCNGGELFDVALSGNLTEQKIKTYSWELVQAVEYLHRHRIGHRDLSLENVLLKDSHVKLMDFGAAVRSHDSVGTPLRFFSEVGKAFYRGPECYVPARKEVPVTPPSSSQPGDIVMTRVLSNYLCEVRLPDNSQPGENCSADVWGYEACPQDIFGLGICIFILAFQCPAWQEARLSNHFFKHYYNCEKDAILLLLELLGKQNSYSADMMQLISSLLHVTPAKRPTAKDCLGNTWFARMSSREDEQCFEGLVAPTYGGA